MTLIDIPSIKSAVTKGTLIELSSDYRTSSTIKAALPKNVAYAMSTTAFRQHILKGTAVEKQSRVNALCAVLSSVLKMGEAVTRPWVECQFYGGDGRPQSYPLKVEWFAPNKYWVLLLPDESLRAVGGMAALP